MGATRFVFWLAALTGAAIAQDKEFVFEVASVRPAAPGAPPPAIGRGANDEGLLTIRNQSLQRLLLRAFDLPFSLRDSRLVGPPWLENQKFDIVAKIPPASSPEQVNRMLQNLLIERFALKFHHETREFRGFELVVAKGGVKMQESGEPTGPHAAPEPPANGKGPAVMVMSKDKDGLPQLPPGRKGALMMSMGSDHTRRTARLQVMTEIAQFCESVLNVPVIDRTGLTGTYDYNLDFSTGGHIESAADGSSIPSSSPDVGAPPLVVAIGRLGLKLEKKKFPIDVIVIDQVTKTPIEN